jgi:hypothetical protein
LAGAAIEELVPQAVTPDTIVGAARKQAARAAGEAIDSLPAAREAAGKWLDRLQKGEIPVGVRLADIDRLTGRFETLARLIAVVIVLAGMVIGSAIAASIQTEKSVFRTNLSDAALVLYLVSTAIAVLLVAALLWRLVRPARRSHRRES